jgi:hypothetical protein
MTNWGRIKVIDYNKMAKRKKTIKKNSKDLINKNLKKETTGMPLFGIKIIVLVLLIYALYSFIMIVLYIFAVFVGGPVRDYMLTGAIEENYLEYFISTYGQVKAENFFLLIGLFVSLITFVLDFWFCWGLWKKKNWARVTISAFSIVLFIISLLDLIYAGYNSAAQIIWLVLYGICPLYLLLNKEVRKAYL